MTYVVLALGGILAIGGILGIIFPTPAQRIVRNISFTPRIRYSQAFIRFTIGIILYLSSHQTNFPITIQIFAMLSVLDGILTLVINPATIQKWIDQVSHLPAFTFQLLPVSATALGIFLIYAAP